MPAPDQLGLYIGEERARPFAWGRLNGDCMLYVAGWLERLRWPLAGLPWRDRYSDEAGARALLAAQGGAVAAVSALLGPPAAGRAMRGDVGLYAHEGGHVGLVCFDGPLWSFRHRDRGLLVAKIAPSFAWSTGFAPPRNS